MAQIGALFVSHHNRNWQRLKLAWSLLYATYCQVVLDHLSGNLDLEMSSRITVVLY